MNSNPLTFRGISDAIKMSDAGMLATDLVKVAVDLRIVVIVAAQ